MSRIHAPELEDYDWFPAPLRDGVTDLLRASTEVARFFDGAVPIVEELLKEHGSDRIVDLCSGGGGPALTIAREVERRRGTKVELLLTDKFPNHAAFDRAESEFPGLVRAERESVDAAALPAGLTGVRTLFNALHHFRPALARSIFADAARARQPIASFEIAERSIQGALMVSTIPLGSALITPFLKPRSLLRFALTYALPVLPAVTCWDGLASCLRAYSRAELLELVVGLEDDGYAFRVVEARSPYLRARMTALVGAPVTR